MKLLPHQVLKKLAENARRKAQLALASMNARRHALQQQREAALDHIRRIRRQRELSIRMSVQAGALQMFDTLIADEKRRIADIEAEMNALHEQEQELLRQWLKNDQREKAFARMDDAFIERANKALDRRNQQMADDRIASRMPSRLATSV